MKLQSGADMMISGDRKGEKRELPDYVLRLMVYRAKMSI